MKPLFFIGNRRSGTTMMSYLLNTHPHIYMASEADTLWYLNSNRSDKAHPDDHPYHLNLDEQGPSNRDRVPNHDHVIGGGSPRSQFERDILWYAHNGIPGHQDPYPEKTDLRWIGDKKPNITTDPRMCVWFEEYFWDARLIHFVRDPVNCIASMAGLNWASGDVAFLTEYYCRLEDQALKMSGDYPTLFLRYEQVCEDEEWAMKKVCEFLGLDVKLRDQELKRGVVMRDGYATAFRRLDPSLIPITPELDRLRESYAYS